LKLRIPLVLLAALAAVAIPAGSAFASSPTFVAPANSATISQNQTLSVDVSGVAGAAGVDFYLDDGAGNPSGFIGGFSSDIGGNYSDNGSGLDSFQLAVGGWDDGAITIDAKVVDSLGVQLALISKNVTINNSLMPLVQGSFSPSASGTKSGAFTLSLTPSDQNNVITAGNFSVNSGETNHPLTSDGNGHWSAPVDTVALGVPNGALDIRVHLEDAAGNTSDTEIWYTIGNPQVPVITPGTLVADKSLYRTDETSLEVGDIVEAYGMQATGYPAPTLHYLWNVCRGQVCNGTTPGPDGSYTVQAADEGADLTLVATASNGVDPGAFTLVDFGVIAPAYVYPNDGGYGDAPQEDPTPASTPAPPVVVLPVATPPVVILPATPLVTPAEQKAINIAQQAVQSKAAAVATAVKAMNIATQAVKIVQKKVNVAVDAVSAGTATATEKKKLFSTVTKLVAVKVGAAGKVEAAKAITTKALLAQKASVQTVNVAQQAVVAAKTAVATGASTPAEKKRLVKTEIAVVAARAVVSAKTSEVATVTKQLVVTKAAADQSVRIAQTNVSVALTTVASAKATSAAKNDLVKAETKLATAREVASVKTDSLRLSTAQLAVANQRLAFQKNAARKP
jgi:hypothetical protein